MDAATPITIAISLIARMSWMPQFGLAIHSTVSFSLYDSNSGSTFWGQVTTEWICGVCGYTDMKQERESPLSVPMPRVGIHSSYIPCCDKGNTAEISQFHH